MTIRVLDQAVAGLIAAGEVVERPASVVKELVENALDAGASRISVELKGGAVAYLRVADDGCGIPETELPLAFQRHATSKIDTAADLEDIHTLGFRGEALPSIAAVAEVSVLTRTADATAGSYLALAYGQPVEQGHRGCPPGTTVTIRGLFGALPARAKFLRSATTEVGHVSTVLSQYALAYPEVQFTLRVESREAFRSPGSGDLRDALVAVHGLDLAQAMLAILGGGAVDQAEEGPSVRVAGFVSPPSVHRSSRGLLSFFVNRRWIQSRLLTYAVEEAYQGFLMVGRHPVGVVNLQISPREVDVNVHPAKTEVKFLNERAVFAAVQRAVRATLLADSPVPTFVPRAGDPTPVADQTRLSVFQVGGWETRLPPTQPPDSQTASPPAPDQAPALPILRVLGQVAGTYIIAEGPNGMYLIDQHTAHERVLFEKILLQRRRRDVESQGLLEPLPLELSPRQAHAIGPLAAELASFGFVVEPFGERAFLIRAVPAVVGGGEAASTFLEVVDSLLDDEAKEDREERLATVLACHSAVRAGQTLSMDEMRELLRELESTGQPQTCPHGRPTMIHLSASQLEREFGRR